MDQEKLDRAVEYCLEIVCGELRPFRQIADLIALLRDDPEWTQPQVIEVQPRVIRALMLRNEDGSRPG